MINGRYGDFGHYIFQRYFKKWLYALTPHDLMKIALKKIHDYGYDAEKHSSYGEKILYGRSRENRKERIGKKYQWIAFYELAAQVSDNYKIKISGNSKDEVLEWCKGNFDSAIRSDIDPTLIKKTNINKKSKKIHDSLYSIPDMQNEQWLKNYDDVPNAENLLIHKNNEKDYLFLCGGYKWEEEKNFSDTEKDIFILINSYIVKSKDY